MGWGVVGSGKGGRGRVSALVLVLVAVVLVAVVLVAVFLGVSADVAGFIVVAVDCVAAVGCC